MFGDPDPALECGNQAVIALAAHNPASLSELFGELTVLFRAAAPFSRSELQIFQDAVKVYAKLPRRRNRIAFRRVLDQPPKLPFRATIHHLAAPGSISM